jgi:hypothetical protein
MEVSRTTSTKLEDNNQRALRQAYRIFRVKKIKSHHQCVELAVNDGRGEDRRLFWQVSLTDLKNIETHQTINARFRST